MPGKGSVGTITVGTTVGKWIVGGSGIAAGGVGVFTGRVGTLTVGATVGTGIPGGSGRDAGGVGVCTGSVRSGRVGLTVGPGGVRPGAGVFGAVAG